MNLVKFLSSYSDSQLRSIFSNAVDKYIEMFASGDKSLRPVVIQEIQEHSASQYTWVRSKRKGIALTLCAINNTRYVHQTEEQDREWLRMVREWAQ